MPRRVRIVRQYTVHADTVFVPGVAGHVSPVPLESHWHFPEVLRDSVECLIELAHSGHGVDIGTNAVDVTTGGGRETCGLLRLLKHLRGDGRGSVLAHLRVSLKRGVGEIGREGERLLMLAVVIVESVGSLLH